jgi:hypothetical protein
MRGRICTGGVAALIAAATAVPAQAEVRLTIQNGLVSLTATDATVREILAEWARVGRTRIINGENVPGGPVTIQLTAEPEARALETILRSASGYVAAPRASFSANASVFDRILVMPISTAPRNAPAPQPQLPQAPTVMPQPGGQPGDDLNGGFPPPASPNGPGGIPGPRGPAFNTFPGFPQPQSPPAPATPSQAAPPGMTSAPGFGRVPAGVSVPGMVVQPPQPNQPAQPNQPPFPTGFPPFPGSVPQVPPNPPQ